jgi:phospholipid/cholesterol/gamma-HCH transport system substrate-binding protein
MQSMNQSGERSRNIAVGFTAILGLAGLALLLMLFGYVPKFFESGYLLQVEFPEAAGLNPGSRVKYRGVDIGQVIEVELLAPPAQGVLATARINEGVQLPRGVQPTIDSTSILSGGGILAFNVPTEAVINGEYLAVDGTEPPLKGESTDLLGQLAKAIEGALNGPMSSFDDLKGELRAVSAKVQRLSDVWTDVGENANKLLQPREVIDEGGEPGNIFTVVARADQRLAELKTTLEGINKWVNDEQLQSDFRETLVSTRSATSKIDKEMDNIGAMTADARKSLDQVTRRYMALADDLSQSIKSMQSVLEKADKGDGTIGKLVNDPALYDNINEAADRANEALKELKLLVEKWKAEGVPIQF